VASLSERDLRAVLDFVGEAHDAQDRDEFRAVALPGYRRLVPADYASYNEVLAGGKASVAIAEPELPEWAYPVFARYSGQNPLIQFYLRTRDGRPYRFTDVTTAAKFRQTEIWEHFFKPLGIQHQLAFLLPSVPELMIGIALSRGGRNFTERDRAVLDLTRPHLIQAYRNAEVRERLASIIDALRQGLDAEGTPVIVLGDDETVAFASETARALVEEASGQAPEEGRPLPGALGDWAAEGATSGALPIGRKQDTLLVRRVRTSGRGQVVLLDRAGRVLSPELLRGLGLTPREAAVLYGLALGTDPPALATELSVSPRTVAKHAQRIYAKLGVRNRAQAVATAWAAACGT
jgi:DNA-binding CsgD family transcriptional regulator